MKVKWRRLRLAFFLLASTLPSLASGSNNDNGTTDTSTTGSDNMQQPQHRSTVFLPAEHFGDDDEHELYDEFSDDDGSDDPSQQQRQRILGGGGNSNDNNSASDESRDNYWRNPDYWDDYITSHDDDFYKYVGDPAPPSLLPLTRREIIGFMLASFGAVLGSAGGIGGGGLVLPTFIVAVGLPPRFAFPLSSVTVLGGSLAGLLLNLNRRHPLADRPIIDWDLILMSEPLVLIGTMLGSVLHRVLSEKLLTVLLVLLLSIVAHTTLNKAKKMAQAERRYIEHLKTARSDYLTRVQSFKTAFRMTDTGWSADAIEGTVGTLGEPTLLGDRTADGELKTVLSSETDLPTSPARTQSIDSHPSWNVPATPRNMDSHERQRILILNPDFVTIRSDLLEQEKVTPRSKVLVLMAKFSVLMFLNVTLGGGAFDSPWGIECGGIAYWIIQVIMVAFLFSSAWAAQTYLVNRHELKTSTGFEYVKGDIRWEPRAAVIYPCFFILAGLCAGMFGIGGAIITVPLMLAMGVHPAICTATSATMVFFTALLSASSFAVFNLILWDYAIVCFPLGFIASLIGQGIMQRARQTSDGAANFERNSLIAFCIGIVIMLCALLMTMQYIVQLVLFDDEYSHEGGLCEGYRL